MTLSPGALEMVARAVFSARGWPDAIHPAFEHEQEDWEACATAALAEMWRPRPLDEWHEDIGAALWWYIKDGKVQEAPWVGTPLALGVTVEAHTTTRIITQLDQEHDPDPVIHRTNVGGWPGYHTHWTPLPVPPPMGK